MSLVFIQLANSIQESVYSDVQSTEQLAQAMSDSLSYVHNSADEEETKPWLSLFDFVKVFTAFPPLKFLSWLDLWATLPSVEKGKIFDMKIVLKIVLVL